MFSYILFDLDGTVSDPKAGITGSVQYALHALGIEEPDLDRLEPVSYTHLYGACLWDEGAGVQPP